jgi:hypothetical protein
MRQLISSRNTGTKRLGRQSAMAAVTAVIGIASSASIGSVVAARSASTVDGSSSVALEEFDIIDDDGQTPNKPEIIIGVPEKPKPVPLPPCTRYSCPA